jgi:hypothetical protein
LGTISGPIPWILCGCGSYPETNIHTQGFISCGAEREKKQEGTRNNMGTRVWVYERHLPDNTRLSAGSTQITFTAGFCALR